MRRTASGELAGTLNINWQAGISQMLQQQGTADSLANA